jgi:hypothetical protein
MFVPLKDCLNEDLARIGTRAQTMGQAAVQVPMPFSLVITSELFFGFLDKNGLRRYIDQAKQATTTDMQISLFAQLQEDFLQARFPAELQAQLKECFELVTLDTSNLGKQTKHCILSVQRSVDYEDRDITTPYLGFSSNEFDKFQDIVKKVFIGCFTPSSIADRLSQSVTDFSCALIIHRLPHFETILETVKNEKEFSVQSYVGFIDPGKGVYRDQFTINPEFLRIASNQVVDQRVVCIFDLERNSVTYKEYPNATGQTASNHVVLEAGRLTKRATELTNTVSVKGLFLHDGERLLCLSLRAMHSSKEQQQSVARQALAAELSKFLTSHDAPEFHDQARAVAARLQSPTKETLKEALQLALAITKFEH